MTFGGLYASHPCQICGPWTPGECRYSYLPIYIYIYISAFSIYRCRVHTRASDLWKLPYLGTWSLWGYDSYGRFLAYALFGPRPHPPVLVSNSRPSAAAWSSLAFNPRHASSHRLHVTSEDNTLQDAVSKSLVRHLHVMCSFPCVCPPESLGFVLHTCHKTLCPQSYSVLQRNSLELQMVQSRSYFLNLRPQGGIIHILGAIGTGASAGFSPTCMCRWFGLALGLAFRFVGALNPYGLLGGRIAHWRNCTYKTHLMDLMDTCTSMLQSPRAPKSSQVESASEHDIESPQFVRWTFNSGSLSFQGHPPASQPSVSCEISFLTECASMLQTESKTCEAFQLVQTFLGRFLIYTHISCVYLSVHLSISRGHWPLAQRVILAWFRTSRPMPKYAKSRTY